MDFSISSTEFEQYLMRHQRLGALTDLIAESTDDMSESYLMISPDGRFFDNVGKRYNFSPRISDVGIEAALVAIHNPLISITEPFEKASKCPVTLYILAR